MLGIETAGSLNTLFVDKTGTITKGKFEPKFFISGSLDKYEDYLVRKVADLLYVSDGDVVRIKHEVFS